ncbi:MAG: HD domain-containing phosphohydrolase [Desulfatiglans sp.]|jgi:putative nucleotidyltransferase with HDIG domain|nr:HD domain-containing protein [Thermodesulfobacteriota bacterium]MEE4352648.1 HD domain-containing phosphohydrolase [Desulfatiglans sp.]
MGLTANYEFIAARKTQLRYYRSTPLYHHAKNGGFVLYKPAGLSVNEMRIQQGRMPNRLFIKSCDKLQGLQEVQRVFNKQLKKDIQSNHPDRIKETLVNIMEETLSEPRSGSLEGVKSTINILVSEYTQDTDVIRNLLFVSDKDYTTTLHSINVMTLTLVYASYLGFSLAKKRILGLCALLHDVGKTKININLLTAPRRLTNEEFHEIKRHTTLGYKILSRCEFGNPEVKLTALQHHEKLDGSGYPHGRKDPSSFSQIIGFIDCYEALTNDDRPYRSSADPFKALSLIRREVEAGKFDRTIFEQFAHSLKR